MKTQIQNITLLSGAFLFLFVLAETLYHKYNVKVAYTRKMVHIATGLIALSLPFLFKTHWVVLGLSAGFLLLLLGSQKYNWLPSINAVKRKTIGAQLFPVVLYFSFLFYDFNNEPLFYYLPILLLAICDPIAAFVGKKYPYGVFKIKGHQKTLLGSLGFSIAAVIISIISILLSDQYLLVDNISLIIAIAVIVTLSEALVINGFDNLTIPVSTWTVLLLFHQPIIQYV